MPEGRVPDTLRGKTGIVTGASRPAGRGLPATRIGNGILLSALAFSSYFPPSDS